MVELDVGVRSEPGPDGSDADARYAQEIDEGYILAVGDGMGPAGTGNMAGATAISVIEEMMEGEFEDVSEWVEFAFGETNERIFNHVRLHPEHAGMGITLTVAVLWNDRLHVGHAGDCRLYRLRRGILEQLTTDHTLLGPWVLKGVSGNIIPSEQSGIRHILTRSLGAEENVHPDYFTADVAHGDVFIMCTDGLYRLVSGDRMAKIAGEREPQAAADQLVELAVRRVLTDDATVLVARVADDE